MLNNECVEQLNAAEGRLNYGFDKIKLNIYKADMGSLCNLAENANTIEPPSEDEMEVDVDEPSGDLQDEISTDSDYGDVLGRFYTERELLEDNSGEADATLTEERADKSDDAGPPDKPASQ
ncbi:uncharacterized protein LOC115628127 [Scaptodrosophila lebanonensis]|uniref:Uncharacterized protein LOC115628127 n=1 Tax=Drosophila lebanonensis TaxID=7225 RepID=A0A6J2TTQ9_DROLE|nr:uncharacterized protein LOC115628127 [Scaptodrosophila lebanonensis]